MIVFGNLKQDVSVVVSRVGGGGLHESKNWSPFFFFFFFLTKSGKTAAYFPD